MAGKRKEAKPRPKLEKNDELNLWLNSGGMCAFPDCNKNLLLDDVNKLVSIAEKAHIIAHSSGGPRADENVQFELSDKQIDSIENLILLCCNHHTQVDKNPEKYTAEVLFEYKRQHETWVGKRLSKERKSVAIVHKTKGDPVDSILLSEQLGEFLLDCFTFQDSYEIFNPQIWSEIKKKNIEFYEKLKVSREKFDGVILNVFPLSQIPLLVHLGCMITDTLPVNIFQYDRKANSWIGSHNDIPAQNIQDICLNHCYISNNSKKLIVSLGVSSIIHKGDIKDIIDINSNDFLEFSVKEPVIDCILYSEQVQQVKKDFKLKIEEIIQQNRNIEELHLFYAGPAGLAVELGRCINTTMWPTVYLYHYEFRNKPKYQFAYCI